MIFSLDDIHLTYPMWLLLSPLAVLLLLVVRHKGNITIDRLQGWLTGVVREVYRHPQAEMIEHYIESRHHRESAPRKVYTILNLGLVLLLFSLALAQPFRLGQRLPEPPVYRDVIFLVDTSVSMVLRDYLVNGQRLERMAMLKNVLSHFIDNLNGNRIQLIAYSETPYTLVPLTNDYQLLKYQLNRLEPASLTGRLSDLSKAILYANHHYQTHQGGNKPVIIMLTDARRPIRDIDPRVAAEWVSEQGGRIHTIAIGAASYEAEDKQHVRLIYHPASFQLLEDISRVGNGLFFWAKDTRTLQDALRTIQNVERRESSSEPEYLRHNLYYYPLAIAVGWLLILYLFAVIRRGES